MNKPMTLQEMLDIAMRYETYMADAMIIACIQRHHETGEPCVPRSRDRLARGQPERRPAEEITEDELLRLVERNADTRMQHC